MRKDNRVAQTNINRWVSSQPENIQRFFADMTKAIKPRIEFIHEQPNITQNYYGEYMTAITQLNEKYPKISIKTFGVIFLLCDANPFGIEAAIKNLI
jgi:hypothetical protein